jgi:hypothetical protein
MKIKIILPALSILSLITLQVNAQWINSVSLTPANPTSNDTIRFIVNSNFPSGDCDQSTQFVQVNGNFIDAYTIHCLGFATFICNDTDTFTVNPLPQGNYTFRIQLDMGIGPVPCTPGIVPVQTDSVNFTVTTATGVGEYIQHDEIMLLPNPASEFISVKSHDSKLFPIEIQIVSVDGKRCGNYIMNDHNELIDIRHLSTGLYQVQLTDSGRMNHYLPLMITR